MNAYGIESVWDVEIDPRAGKYADPHRYDAESSIDSAMEKVIEWSYDDDPHGYCHDRAVLIGLLQEIERLRGVRG